MKSKLVQRVLRALIALLGASVGAGLTAMAQQMLAQANPEYHVPVQALVIVYISVCALGALIGFLLSNRIIRSCVDWACGWSSAWRACPLGRCSAPLPG